ncbi:MAG TPA: hypothetical protein VII33_16985 [Nakamurella sp.]
MITPPAPILSGPPRRPAVPKVPTPGPLGIPPGRTLPPPWTALDHPSAGRAAEPILEGRSRTGAESFTDVTCSGAKTSDFLSSQAPGVAPQLAAVTNKTRLVTMTIGGNDGDAFRTILNGYVTASLASRLDLR